MQSLTKTFRVQPRDFVKAGEASLKIQRLLKDIGFDPTLIRRVAVCAYESEMNVVMYGGEGKILLEVSAEKISVITDDDGPGIEDIEKALQEGYSTAPPEYREMGFGAGMGLPNIKKNADLFEIRSGKGDGTTLVMSFEVRQ
ncbi:MAG: ATP-binding protein [Deltaproteobacteria bacterium]|mgnify:CR=1 FL=1|nr:ATP-binding protein [Deltaproteobacteria bacterium]MBW2083419.1 ATP-binding protein [Deltaproteobacteria bacterium]HDM09669.1 anti-sigma regulatory factor [Desulfobacteraceae bacterium]